MAGRSTRAFAVAAFVLAGLAPGADAAPVPTLAGETVITATRTAKMRVRVPQRALFSIDTAKSVDIDGGGRVAGVILRENAATSPDEAMIIRRPQQHGSDLYVSAPMGAPKGCDRSLEPARTDCSKATWPDHYDLRRGTYTLYVVTDGAPVRITLRFANLRGSTTLTPSTPVASGSSAFRTSVAAPVSWSGGTKITTPAAGFLFTFAWWQQDESVAARAGVCWYHDSDGIEELGEYRWLPGCPQGSSGSGAEVANPVYGAWGPARGGKRGSMGISWTAGATKVGMGAWADAQNVRGGGGFAYWLSF